MSIFEYNEAEEKEKMRKAERAGGYEEGVAAGIADGIQQGIQQGIQRSIGLMIEAFIEVGNSKQDTLAKIKEKFGLEETEAQKYMEEYWK